MKRWFAFWVLVGVCAACAPALKDLKPNLSASDSARIGVKSLSFTFDWLPWLTDLLFFKKCYVFPSGA